MSAALAALVVCTTSNTASAVIVSTTATLTAADTLTNPATDPFPGNGPNFGLNNQLQVALPNFATSDPTGKKATDYVGISGNYSIDVDYDPVTGVVNSFSIPYVAATVSGTPITINVLGGINVTASTLGMTTSPNPFKTPVPDPPASVVVTGGQFNANDVSAILDGGQVVALGSTALDFSDDPLTVDGGPQTINVGTTTDPEVPVPWAGDPVYPFVNPTNPGPGTFVLTADGNGGWDYEISVPYSTGAELLANVVLTLQNRITATGNLPGAVVIPEPTSGLFLAALVTGAGAVVRRRRK